MAYVPLEEEKFGNELPTAGKGALALAELEGGGKTLHVYFDRKSRAVTLHYDNNHTTTGAKNVVDTLREQLGERDAKNVRWGIIGGELVVQLPAQVYVDKLDGEVPGFKRQVG